MGLRLLRVNLRHAAERGDEMSETFKLAIELGNEAMPLLGEAGATIKLAGALNNVAAKIALGETSGPIMDLNGNRVGQYAVIEGE